MSGIPSWLNAELVWFIIGLVLLLLEFTLPGIIIFFFGIGAWITGLVCFFVDIDVNVQLIIFLVSSVVLLLLFRKRIKGMFEKKEGEYPNLESPDEFRGRKVKVVREIAPDSPGKVEFRGTQWAAEADVSISEGATVEIVDKSNITLKVKPV